MSGHPVAIISGSRAEAGLLMVLLRRMQEFPELSPLLYLTGTHLSSKHGLTRQEFIERGFSIAGEVRIPLEQDAPADIAHSMGACIEGFCKIFTQDRPALVIILGDRFEIFAVAQAALLCHIPIAHIHGGELTLGAIDDAFRHSITKMAQLHFTSTDIYRQRVIQLGEQPEHVFNTGALAVDLLHQLPQLSRNELEKKLGIDLGAPVILVTWHPETARESDPLQPLKALLEALEQFNDHQIVFTRANADSGGDVINRYLDSYVPGQSNMHLYSSLGQQIYFSLIRLASVVTGNSSSALFEAPALRVPSVNIGSRQEGRYRPASVIDCQANTEAIVSALKQACTDDHLTKCQTMHLPYGDGDTAGRICQILSQADFSQLNKKPFYDIAFTVK